MVKRLNFFLPVLGLSLGLGLGVGPWVARTQMVEICDNGRDDDADGRTDLNDPDCACAVLEPVSLIPNPSFEEMNCCPNTRSQLDCSKTWIQASEPTTDYLHRCGWMGWPEFPPPQPFPDGDGIVGFRDGRVIRDAGADMNWKEYAGACLLSPLLANTAYRFEFFVGFADSRSSPPINITFFGSTDCANLPFGQGNESFGCPTNGPGWVRLGSTTVSGIREWVKAGISVVPNQHITAIAIGPDCPGVFADQSTYYFFDNLVLADQRTFEFRISGTHHPCSNDFSLQVPADTNYRYQWYKEGIALVGETGSQLQRLRGEGRYQVRLLSATTCQVTQEFIYRRPIINRPLEVSICEGESYPFGSARLSRAGSYIDTFKTVNNCDSIVPLRLEVVGQQLDSVRGRIFPGESFQVGHLAFRTAGRHLATLSSRLGCDSLVYLELDYYRLFIPNVFSPNNDGINDSFNVLGGEDLREVRRLQVFDRWGALIYDGDMANEEQAGWDGNYRGQPAAHGIYTYVATVTMDDGRSRQFSGAVTLLR